MTNFRPGEVIDLTIRGARVVRYEQPFDDPASLVFVTQNSGDEVTVNLPWNGVEVTRVAPPEWPPQPGDMWRDRNGRLHFGVAYIPDYDRQEDAKGIDGNGVRVVLLSQDADETCNPGSGFHRPERVNQDRGPLVLIHRERCSMCSKPRSAWETNDRLCRPDSRDCPTCLRTVCAQEAAMIRREDV